jgi:small-conductance mechanosensitive channel
MKFEQYQVLFIVLAVFVGGTGLLPVLAKYKLRLLCSAACLLACAFALYSSGDNASLIRGTLDRTAVMHAIFKIAFWIAAALLGAAIMNFVFSHWIFPERGRPKRRKLFADLSVALIYFVAGAGILNAIFGPSFEAVLATSGIIALVVGLALQSTLADLFAGLALNIERPFRAGEWISISGGPEGQLHEINWRAARLKSRAGNLIAIPNSVLAKSVVTNQSRPAMEHLVSVEITFAHLIDPDAVTELLVEGARALSIALPVPTPSVYLLSNSELGITYELDFYVKNVADVPFAMSEALRQIWSNCRERGVSPAVPRRELYQGKPATRHGAAVTGMWSEASAGSEPVGHTHSPSHSLQP